MTPARWLLPVCWVNRGECETPVMSCHYADDPRSQESFAQFKGPYETYQPSSVTPIVDHCRINGISSYDVGRGVGGLSGPIQSAVMDALNSGN